MRLTLIAAVAAALMGGCAGSASHNTAVSMLALNPDLGRATFHLRCDPPNGDLPSPKRACAALRADPRLLSAPTPFICFGGPSSHWQLTISGRLDGKLVRHSFDTCWTPQMATLGRFGMTWPVLLRHLLPRRHEVVLPGETRTFPPGVLRAADLVTCDILGHHLSVGVPLERGPGASATNGFGGVGVVSVHLTAAHQNDSSVVATCGKGAR